MSRETLLELKAAILATNNDFISFAEVVDKLSATENITSSETALFLQKIGAYRQNLATRTEAGIVTPIDDPDDLERLCQQFVETGPDIWVGTKTGQQAHAEGCGWIRSKFVASLESAGLDARSIEALAQQGDYRTMPDWDEQYHDPVLVDQIESLQTENKRLREELTILQARINLPDSDRVPEELDICLTVWAFAEKAWSPSGGKTPRKVIESIIEKHYKDKPKNVKDRISAVCNWDKDAGRKNYEQPVP